MSWIYWSVFCQRTKSIHLLFPTTEYQHLSFYRKNNALCKMYKLLQLFGWDWMWYFISGQRVCLKNRATETIFFHESKISWADINVCIFWRENLPVLKSANTTSCQRDRLSKLLRNYKTTNYIYCGTKDNFKDNSG